MGSHIWFDAQCYRLKIASKHQLHLLLCLEPQKFPFCASIDSLKRGIISSISIRIRIYVFGPLYRALSHQNGFQFDGKHSVYMYLYGRGVNSTVSLPKNNSTNTHTLTHSSIQRQHRLTFVFYATQNACDDSSMVTFGLEAAKD